MAMCRLEPRQNGTPLCLNKRECEQGSVSPAYKGLWSETLRTDTTRVKRPGYISDAPWQSREAYMITSSPPTTTRSIPHVSLENSALTFHYREARALRDMTRLSLGL